MVADGELGGGGARGRNPHPRARGAVSGSAAATTAAPATAAAAASRKGALPQQHASTSGSNTQPRRLAAVPRPSGPALSVHEMRDGAEAGEGHLSSWPMSAEKPPSMGPTRAPPEAAICDAQPA